MTRAEFRQLKPGDVICRLGVTWLIVLKQWSKRWQDTESGDISATVIYHVYGVLPDEDFWGKANGTATINDYYSDNYVNAGLDHDS